MSSNNNNYSQYYQGDLSKNSSGWSSYRKKYQKTHNYPQNNMPISKSPYSKQQPYQVAPQSTRNPSKKSVAQEFPKQNQPKFQISSDSDDYENDPQQDKQSYSYKPASPVLSIESHQHLSQQQNHPNKHQQIYELKMKIMSLENQYLVDKKQLIDKYEKQLFDLNKAKLTLQQDKARLNKELDSLNRKIETLSEQNQQLKEQMQVFVGDNRKTPNFNSKDFGDVDLIIMNANKDQKIKNLQNQLNAISKQKQMIETSLTKNKADRSSGQSFGHRKQVAMSFGQIQENLRSSLRQTNKINQNLNRQVDQIKKQLEHEQERATKLTIQNMALQADRQVKHKQIQSLSEKLIKAQGKVYLLEKQQQNYSKKINQTEDLLEAKEKELRKFKQSLQNHEEKMKKMIRQFQKSQKDWINKNNRLQVEITMTINEKMDHMKKQQARLLDKIDTLITQNRSLAGQNKNLLSENKSLQSENKSLSVDNKTLQSENKSLSVDSKTLQSQFKSLQLESKSLQAQIKYIQGENKSLVSQVKRLKQRVDQLGQRQERLTAQLMKREVQSEETVKKSQQITKKVTKLKNTCGIQEQRIIQLQKSLVSAKQQKKNLKQQAEKIMRKQKNQISTLKQSLQLMTEKQQQIKSQSQNQTDLVTKVTTQSNLLKKRVEQLTDEVNELSQVNESMRNEIAHYEDSILELKKQNYEMNKQLQILNQSPQRQTQLLQTLKQQIQSLNNNNLRLTQQCQYLSLQLLKHQPQQSPSKQPQNQSPTKQPQHQSPSKSAKKLTQSQPQKLSSPQLKKAYTQLQLQFTQLQTKFDKQTTEKQQMLQALNSKITYFETRYNDDLNRIQETKDQKDYYMKQAQNLTYKCQEMYEYIQKIHAEGNGLKQNQQGNGENAQTIQELLKENECLKKQVYRLSSQLQVLQSQFKGEIMKKQSLKSLSSPQNKKLRQSQPQSPKHNDQSSSLEFSIHQPLQSALQIMKLQKQQMIQTINYQNQMIQSLHRDMLQAVRTIEQLKGNQQSQEYIRNKEMVRVIHEKNRQILEGKIMQVNDVIKEKEDVIREITERNLQIMNEFREFQEEQSEYINRLTLEMNIIKDEKKQLHEQIDNANTQLMQMEKEKSKNRSQIVKQLRQELQSKLIFLNEDMKKLKNQIRKLKKQQQNRENDHQLQIKYRQELYSKERTKLMLQIQTLSKQLSASQQKMKKANLMIGEQKTLQSEISKRNQKIELEYFDMKNQVNVILRENEQLTHKNHNLTAYCQEIEHKNNQVISEMHHQIESLIAQNQQANQKNQTHQNQIDHLQTQNIALLLQIKQQKEHYPIENPILISSQLYQHPNNQLPSRDSGYGSIKAPYLTDKDEHSQTINKDFIMMQDHNNDKTTHRNDLSPKTTEIQVNCQKSPQEIEKRHPILDLYGNQPTTNTTFHYPETRNIYPTQDITFSKAKNTYKHNYHTIKNPQTYCEPYKNTQKYFEPYKQQNQQIRGDKVSYYRI